MNGLGENGDCQSWKGAKHDYAKEAGNQARGHLALSTYPNSRLFRKYGQEQEEEELPDGNGQRWQVERQETEKQRGRETYRPHSEGEHI